MNNVTLAPALEDLLACCDSTDWARKVLRDGPYPTLDALLAASDNALRALPWHEVSKAMAAHPRIGERVAGGGRAKAWSRGEQSGVSQAPQYLQDALVRANVSYERRFGHVFLICATGLDAPHILAAIEKRLRHNLDTERQVVRAQLAAITRLRLAKLVRS